MGTARYARVLGLVAALLPGLSAKAAARDFYADPAAAGGGDGSQGAPWQTVEAVQQAGRFGAAIQPGDTLWLRSGYHGELALSGGSYATPITIAAAPGEAPRLRRVSFRGTRGVVVRGLSISPSHAAAPQVGTMVDIDAASADIVVEQCELFSVADASGWSAAQWVDEASSGLQVSGDRVTVRGNALRNVRFGISVDGQDALVSRNQIVGFSADGLRGLGDGGVFEYNVVKNAYVSDADGDDNHDDGFQSWSNGPSGPGSGVVTGVVLRGNVFINREDPGQPLSNALQGIGCFDGFFDGWVVENNVVVTDHWHGISFYGLRNSRIVNNTVIDVNDTSPGPPWILVTAHKDGTASQSVVVRNNLATDFSLEADALTEDHNTTLQDLGAFFADPGGFDLHLRPDAPAVDTGSADQAPALDADGVARPQGSAVDLGAYEWHAPQADAGAAAIDAGTPTTDAGGSDAALAVGASGSGAQAGRGGAAGDGPAATDGGLADTPPHGDAGRTGGCGCTIARSAPITFGPFWLVLALVALRHCARRRRGGPPLGPTAAARGSPSSAP